MLLIKVGVSRITLQPENCLRGGRLAICGICFSFAEKYLANTNKNTEYPMEHKIITKESADLALFDQMFTEAFPPEERILPSALANANIDLIDIRLNGFYEDGKPVGMMVTLDFPEFVYILFLATSAEYRGQGIGTKIMNAYYEQFPEAFTIGVIEKPDEAALNNAQRLARKKFYDRLGFSFYDFDFVLNGLSFLTIAKGPGSDSRVKTEQAWTSLLPLVAPFVSGSTPA